MNQETPELDQAEIITNLLIKDLEPIGSVTAARRLHGFALFEDGVMFGFVEQDGTIYLRATMRTAERFNQLGSTKHAEMPYWSVPMAIASNVHALRDLAYQAADNAHLAASFGIEDAPTPITPKGGTLGAVTRTVVLLAA